MIATNCDRLEIYVGGRHLATGDAGRPVRPASPTRRCSPDLTVGGPAAPELRIDGYVGGAAGRVGADVRRHHRGTGCVLTADDTAIKADGTDTTRVTFRATRRLRQPAAPRHRRRRPCRSPARPR